MMAQGTLQCVKIKKDNGRTDFKKSRGNRD